MFSMRVAQNVHDPLGKQAKNDYLGYLKLTSDLQEKYSEANNKYYRDQKLGIEPVPIEETDAQKNIDNLVKQRETAFKNLKRITSPTDAGNILFQLLENPDQLKVFNRFFSGFQKDIGLQENITLPIFNILWNRYKAKLATTKETGIAIGPEQEEFKDEIDSVKNKIVAAANEAVGANDINREEFKTIIARANEEAGNRNYLKLLDLFNSFQKTLSESSRLNVEAINNEIKREEDKMQAQINEAVAKLDKADPDFANKAKEEEERIKNKFSHVLNLLNSVAKSSNVNLEVFENQLKAERDKLESEARALDIAQKALLEEEKELFSQEIKPHITIKDIVSIFRPESLIPYEGIKNVPEFKKDIEELLSVKKEKILDKVKEYMKIFGTKYVSSQGFKRDVKLNSNKNELIEYLLCRKYNIIPPSVDTKITPGKKLNELTGFEILTPESISLMKSKQTAAKTYEEFLKVAETGQKRKFKPITLTEPEYKKELEPSVFDINVKKVKDLNKFEKDLKELRKNYSKVLLEDIYLGVLTREEQADVDAIKKDIKKISKQLERVKKEKYDRKGETPIVKVQQKGSRSYKKEVEKAKKSEKEGLKSLVEKAQEVEYKYEEPEIIKSKIVKKKTMKISVPVIQMEAKEDIKKRAEFEKEKAEIEKEFKKWLKSVQTLNETMPDEKSEPKKYEEYVKAYTFQTNYLNDLEKRLKEIDVELNKLKGGGFAEFRRKKHRQTKGRGIEVEWNSPAHQEPIDFKTVEIKGVPKIDRYVQFGNYLLHMPNLYKGYLKMTYPSKIAIKGLPKKLITDTFRQIIYNLLTDDKMNQDLIDDLDDEELKLLEKIITLSRTDINKVKNIYNKTELLNNARNKDLKRFKLLQGEILAGNDAPALLKEFKLLLLKLTNDGVINKVESSKVMYDLLCYLS